MYSKDRQNRKRLIDLWCSPDGEDGCSIAAAHCPEIPRRRSEEIPEETSEAAEEEDDDEANEEEVEDVDTESCCCSF